jgi:hypothetical protein
VTAPSTELVTTTISGSNLVESLLDRGGWSHRPNVTKLAARVRAMETNALRYPIWRPSRSSQLTLFDQARVYGHPVVVGGTAKARDLPLLIEWVSRFIREGCPEDGIVDYTLEEASGWLAYAWYGGHEAAKVKQAVRRVRSVVLEEVAVRLGAGDPEVEHGFGFIDNYWFETRGKGRARIELSKTFAGLVRLGSVTLLDNPTMRKLLATDEIALRVWLFLESEKGPGYGPGFFYHVFPDATREMPSISQLVWLQGARRKVLERLRRAFKAIEEADPRYTLRYEGGWLNASRHSPSTSVSGDGRLGVIKTDGEGSSRRTVRGHSEHHNVVGNVVVKRRSDDEDDVAFLEEHGTTITPKVYNLLKAIASRHGGRSWNRDRLEEAPTYCPDYIAFLKDADEHWRAPPRPLLPPPVQEDPPPLTPEQRAGLAARAAEARMRIADPAAC